jgi:hypothetical protein
MSTLAIFLQVDAPNVVVENWKTAEDGHGAIVRLLEVGGKSADVRLDFPLFNLEKAGGPTPWRKIRKHCRYQPIRWKSRFTRMRFSPCG